MRELNFNNQMRSDPAVPAAGRYAVDSHVHVLDVERFPLSNPEGYVPQANECGTAYELRTTLDAHGFTHALLVNPFAGYATDNRCMLDAIEGSAGRYKGVALVGHDTDDAAFQRLTDGGVIGARFNTLFAGSTSLHGAAGERLLQRIKAHGWFAQIYYHDDGLVQLLPILHKAGVRIVVDHCGCPDPSLGVAQPGFQALLELGRGGAALIKLSGAFRYSRQSWPYRDTEPYIEALIDAFTLERCVWGSDWPFVRVPKRMDYGPGAKLLERWLPEHADRHKVLWETPSRWFGFSVDQ
jgi:predicted TIM-barrel fold metal-dependent hydrolase